MNDQESQPVNLEPFERIDPEILDKLKRDTVRLLAAFQQTNNNFINTVTELQNLVQTLAELEETNE
jgi:hypothetical protein